jgi:heat shock protein HslJ
MKKLALSMKKVLTITASLFILSACAIESTAPSSSQPNKPLLEQPQLSTSLQGMWRVEYIKSRPVIDNSPATLVFSAKNKLSGQASCNNFFASYQISDKANKTPLLTVSQAGTTRKMCAPALMEQESRLLTTLPNITSYQVTNNILTLFDKSQKALFKAVKVKLKNSYEK